VLLRTKEPSVDTQALAEEFAHDLMHAGLRTRLSRSTSELREQYVGRALFGKHEDSTIAELLAELDEEDLDQEPLMIEVPWERKGRDDG
jgi:hypothetical protein